MKKVIKRTLLFLFVTAVLVGGIFVYEGYEMYEEAVTATPIEEKIKQIKENTKNYSEIEDVPEIYKNALVAVEDKRFYKHNGVDIISIGRAIVTDIKEMAFVEGGSTITQQLAKNIYFTQEKKITRKIAEVFAAIEFEKVLSKDEILELYINTCLCLSFDNSGFLVGEYIDGAFGIPTNNVHS